MAVLSYLFRRVEREIEDRRPTIIVIDEAWKALDNAYFAERLSNWLVTARKQNTVAVMMTQYASQLERTRTGKTIVEAVPTQILLPNIRAHPLLVGLAVENAGQIEAHHIAFQRERVFQGLTVSVNVLSRNPLVSSFSRQRRSTSPAKLSSRSGSRSSVIAFETLWT